MTTYFSITDANKILPTVIKKFNYSKMLKNEIIKIEEQIGSDFTSKTSVEDYTILKQKLNRKVTEFYQSIEDLESLGVVLKGLNKDCLIFLQNVLMRKFGFAGKREKRRLNFGMKRILDLWEENQLV